MTGLPVNHGFENSKNGYKSARLVRRYRVRLLPELFEHLNPMPYEHAVQMEKDLADDLRAQGYAVCGGTWVGCGLRGRGQRPQPKARPRRAKVAGKLR